MMDNGVRGKGISYGFNYNKDSCNTKDCKWEHKRIDCKSKDHTIDSCQNKHY